MSYLLQMYINIYLEIFIIIQSTHNSVTLANNEDSNKFYYGNNPRLVLIFTHGIPCKILNAIHQYNKCGGRAPFILSLGTER
jgi:hypothetical protein